MYRPKRLGPENTDGVNPVLSSSIPLSDLLKILLYSLITTLLLPIQSGFPYRYERGQPWNYATLKAPFDFEVLRPYDEISAEVARIKQENGPCLLLNNQIAEQNTKLLHQLIEEQVRIAGPNPQFEDLVKNQSAYKRLGTELLDHIYQIGILPSGDPLISTLSQNTPVLVISGTQERQSPLSELFTVRKAHDWLIDTLPYSALRQPELLLPMFEKTITANLNYSDSLSQIVLKQKLTAAVSTGIFVRKGEKIVQRDEIVDDDDYRKISSLATRQERKQGWENYLGFGLLAFLAFSILYLIMVTQGLTLNRELRLIVPVIIIALLALIRLAFGLGAPVALLLPLHAIPLILRRLYTKQLAITAWAMVVGLCAIPLEWGAAWILIQSLGLIAAIALLHPFEDWKTRVAAAVGVAFTQTIVWMAAGLAGMMPEGVWNLDTVLFFAASAIIALFAFPFADFVYRQSSRHLGA